MHINLDKGRGTLWGQAVGDALGTTAEFESAERARTPRGAWPKELIGEGAFGLLPGQVTDDTELALALGRSLARQGRYDEEDVAAAYARWRTSDPFDCGMATDTAFGRGLKPGPGLAERMRARANKTTQANGSLMRSSPLGVFGATLARPALAELAAGDSRLSHPDPVCQAACAVFVTTIAEAVRGEAELFARALAFAEGTPVHETLVAAMRELPVSDQQSQGWVRIALQHAFFHLHRGTPFERALVETISMGGDTDTNAAIVGALLGAAQGVEAIPARWRETVRTCSPPRPAEYQCGDLDALAATLAAGPRANPA